MTRAADRYLDALRDLFDPGGEGAGIERIARRLAGLQREDAPAAALRVLRSVAMPTTGKLLRAYQHFAERQETARRVETLAGAGGVMQWRRLLQARWGSPVSTCPRPCDACAHCRPQG